MRKKILALLLALACVFCLTGCLCQHEFAEANCVDPATCTKCGKTEGAALGHVWMAATCTEPKTCEVCGLSDGEAKGHDWVDASCTEAKHCTACNTVDGEALGHDWIEATTEAPKTCAVCQLTEGERIITDPRFKTQPAAPLFGKWTGEIMLPAEFVSAFGATEDLSMVVSLDFGRDGVLSLSAGLSDEAAFMDMMLDFSLEVAYAEFEAQGLSREYVDSIIYEAYGMSVRDYVAFTMADFDLNELLASIYDSMGLGGVYYVEDGLIYVGDSWEFEMEPSAFTIEGDELIIESFSMEFGDGDDVVLHRVAKDDSVEA